jgi:hypothetical protein
MVTLFAWTVLFAQQLPPDTSVPGATGWVGTGLLGTVLAWLLLVHLPTKDNAWAKDSIKSIVEANRLSMIDIAAGFKTNIADILSHHQTIDAERRAASKEALDSVLKHCEAEFSGIVKEVKTELERVGTVVTDFRTFLANFYKESKYWDNMHTVGILLHRIRGTSFIPLQGMYRLRCRRKSI